VNPQQFLYYGIKLNKYFERNNFKLFLVLQQHSTLIPKNIILDITAIRNLFLEGNKRLPIRKNEEFIWSSVFKIDHFKKKDCLFNYMIHINGHSISIIFTTPKKAAAKNHRSKASVNAKNNIKDKMNDRKEKIERSKRRKNNIAHGPKGAF
jgi:hypothetical protein